MNTNYTYHFKIADSLSYGSQGVQAQTVANFFLAFEAELQLIPVLNKIDLKNADPESCKEQLEKLFDIDPCDVIQVRNPMFSSIKCYNY